MTLLDGYKSLGDDTERPFKKSATIASKRKSITSRNDFSVTVCEVHIHHSVYYKK